jgi:hypothetical protein
VIPTTAVSGYPGVHGIRAFPSVTSIYQAAHLIGAWNESGRPQCKILQLRAFCYCFLVASRESIFIPLTFLVIKPLRPAVVHALLAISRLPAVALFLALEVYVRVRVHRRSTIRVLVPSARFAGSHLFKELYSLFVRYRWVTQTLANRNDCSAPTSQPCEALVRGPTLERIRRLLEEIMPIKNQSAETIWRVSTIGDHGGQEGLGGSV